MASVSVMTITRFETGKTRAQAANLRKLRHALESAGVEFVDSNGGGPGVRMHENKKSPP